MEIKNKLTVTRGEVEGDNGGKGCQGICMKDTWTKPKVGRIRVWEVGMARVGAGSGGRKMDTTVLGKQQQKIFLNIITTWKVIKTIGT